ncbi:uncharacterized protein LOC106096983 isoform X2 [Oreochromis niloticus]|uniref:uncharacterized protein LOC106096983 isoform X2 n=1 Tax=Oreochromis niloticus TaxID=8128 RepID=UPI0009053673|nr:uncharacterized protein LOC106096983 isoform X2 [Oreochromis niloticus]
MCFSYCVALFVLTSVMSIMILLFVQDQKVDAVSLRIVPNRLQFFVYESLTFHCEGVKYCEVVHKFRGKIKSCSEVTETRPTGSSCPVKIVYTDNNGEYWYEPEAGRRSNIINLSVTAGPVILESPAVPLLMEEMVTLSCRMKNPSTNFKADFYKNGRLIHRSSTGNMTIHRIFKSDEGFYKCIISGVGESPESWLKVTDSQSLKYTHNLDNSVCHSSAAATPCIITTILVSALLVAVGLHHFGKGYWKRETGTVDADREIYAAVRKTGDEDTLPSKPSCHSVGLGDTQQQEAGTSTEMSSAGPCKPKAEDPLNSTKPQVAERAPPEKIVTSE